ncbi:hypothetical protein Esti_004978 [Eimeria stiedai]
MTYLTPRSRKLPGTHLLPGAVQPSTGGGGDGRGAWAVPSPGRVYWAGQGTHGAHDRCGGAEGVDERGVGSKARCCIVQLRRYFCLVLFAVTVELVLKFNKGHDVGAFPLG